MTTVLSMLVWTLVLAADPVAKLPAGTAKEMTTAVVEINKKLGLENWEAKGEQPCVDRGGLEALIKDVSAEDARACAATAIADGFPGLGKDYTIGIPMADIGPVTVFAIGHEGAEGWGAYSCDPSRKCNPTKLTATSKQAMRLVDRYRRACSDPKTIWLPNRGMVCTDLPLPDKPAKTQAPAKAPTPAGAGAAKK